VTLRVVHIITRLIVGGAQENTFLTVDDQHHLYHDDVTLLAGPGLGPEGSLEDKARARGLDVRLIPSLRRSIHPLRDAASYRAMLRLLREIRPQIVHTHSSKAGILGRLAAGRLGIPAVHTIHGASFHYGQSRAAYRSYILAEKLAARRCRGFISVCDAMTEHYVAAGIAPRERFVTIYSGMEVEPLLNPLRPRDAVRRELGFRPEHVVIAKVARLFHLKGHEFVIAAAKRVLRERPLARFLFVGDGVLRARYQAEIARAGLSEAFVFAGLVPPEKVPELLHASDIVVHTSLWEGLARVLPQALIAGKPVVSYDVDGAREVTIPGETGYLLPPQSVDELAAALIELAGDASLRERMGSAGRARFTDAFRHETMTRRIREVYEELLG
jgi:glycosyltransferase involved in cell wall biosynthesis